MSEFDEKAKQWDENPMHLERTKAVAAAILENIPLHDSMKAMEFGAGTGLLSFFLKDHFAEITLIDTSAEMLKMAELKLTHGDHAKIRTLFLDLEKEEGPEFQFDIIFTQMVLHHIKDVSAMLGKFKTMLVPGGFLAIADLYAEDGSFHDPGVEVHHGFDPEELGGLLAIHGFTDIRHSRCFVIRRETAGEPAREYPVFLIRARR